MRRLTCFVKIFNRTTCVNSSVDDDVQTFFNVVAFINGAVSCREVGLINKLTDIFLSLTCLHFRRAL